MMFLLCFLCWVVFKTIVCCWDSGCWNSNSSVLVFFFFFLSLDIDILLLRWKYYACGSSSFNIFDCFLGLPKAIFIFMVKLLSLLLLKLIRDLQLILANIIGNSSIRNRWRKQSINSHWRTFTKLTHLLWKWSALYGYIYGFGGIESRSDSIFFSCWTCYC